MRSFGFVLLHGLFLMSCSSDDGNIDIDPVAQYRLTFTAIWSAETHPYEFPPNPHFSGIIGMVHNESSSLFIEGTLASEGIKEMAEKGRKTPLDDEIESLVLDGSSYALISGDHLNLSPGIINHEFEASTTHSLISIVSMLAPSPDWFVAVSNVQLIENNEWVEQKTLNFSVYDAGTDSGTSYTSENQTTEPAENISMITTPPLAVSGEVAPIGYVTFERIDK